MEAEGPLNGWKEIAAHLGKSVRAVQRWERDFRLPVHRIKTPTGQIVYAYAAEIDAWRAAMAPRRRELDADKEPAPPAGVADVATPKPAPRAGIRLTAVAVASVLIVTAIGARWLARADTLPAPVVTLEVSGTSISGLSQDRRVLWSYDLGFRPERLKHGEGPLRVAKADVDGDGSPEWLTPIRSASTGGDNWHESIYCFTSDGRLKWTYTPSLSLTYEGRTFDGPWRNYVVAASNGTGRQRVWASYGHHTWWPSFVVELDADGHATPRYYQSGAIYGLASWETGSNGYLAAAGVDNEFESPSLALISIDGPAVTSPQGAGSGFHCDSCPGSGPALFAALPRSEVSRIVPAAYPTADAIGVMGNELKISVNDQFRQGNPGSLYFLRETLTFHDAAFNDVYWIAHRELEMSGALRHDSTNCPGLRGNVREWRPGAGWTTVPISYQPALNPAR